MKEVGHSINDVYAAVVDIKISLGEIKTDIKHHDELILTFARRIKDLEDKVQKIQLENVELKSMKSDIDMLNKNVEGLAYRAEQSLRKATQNSWFIESGNKLFSISTHVVAMIVTWAIAIIVGVTGK